MGGRAQRLRLSDALRPFRIDVRVAGNSPRSIRASASCWACCRCSRCRGASRSISPTSSAKASRSTRSPATSRIQNGVHDDRQSAARRARRPRSRSRASADLAKETQQSAVRVQPALSIERLARVRRCCSSPIRSSAPRWARARCSRRRCCSDPIEQMFSYEYQVTGSWADPVVAARRQPRRRRRRHRARNGAGSDRSTAMTAIDRANARPRVASPPCRWCRAATSPPIWRRRSRWWRAAARRARGSSCCPNTSASSARAPTDKLAVREARRRGPQQDLARRAWRASTASVVVGGTVPIAVRRPGARAQRMPRLRARRRAHRRYDKIHLFASRTATSATTRGGRSSRATPRRLRRAVRPRRPVGLLRPALSRALSRAGRLALILVPAAFTATTGAAHWHLLLRARAVENQCYVLAAAQGGVHPNGRRTYGHSLLIDPWGEIVRRMRRGAGHRRRRRRPGAPRRSARAVAGAAHRVFVTREASLPAVQQHQHRAAAAGVLRRFAYRRARRPSARATGAPCPSTRARLLGEVRPLPWMTRTQRRRAAARSTRKSASASCASSTSGRAGRARLAPTSARGAACPRYRGRVPCARTSARARAPVPCPTSAARDRRRTSMLASTSRSSASVLHADRRGTGAMRWRRFAGGSLLHVGERAREVDVASACLPAAHHFLDRRCGRRGAWAGTTPRAIPTRGVAARGSGFGVRPAASRSDLRSESFAISDLLARPGLP